MKVLLIDNFDSFTYMLKDYIEQCDTTCEVVRNNDSLLETKVTGYDAVIISPGPGKPAEAGKLLHFIKRNAANVPMLGVCLGHQAIAEAYCATVEKAHKPMHGKVDSIHHTGDALFQNMPPNFSATRYHSLVCRNIVAPLIIIATAQHEEVMAIRHTELPVWGIQFHPESSQTQFGLQIIRNFLSLAVQKY